MNEIIKCKNCIFWIEAQIIKNHVGVCARYPEMKDLNTLVSSNVCLCHKYTEENHFCGEYINKEKPHKTFWQLL